MNNQIVLACSMLMVFLTGQTPVYDSGGPLPPEQAAYDVNFYRLNVDFDPADHAIAAAVLIRGQATDSLPRLVLNLDPLLTVDSAICAITGNSLPFEWDGALISFSLPDTALAGDAFAVEIYYHGQPHLADNPPWGGGFNWSLTPAGEPWYGVTCEGLGADVWWPCKDHPSDEADSVAMNYTIPSDLKVIANGSLRSTTVNPDGSTTWHWFSQTPINNYNVTFNIADYVEITTTCTSVAGDSIDVSFWSIPDNAWTAQNWFPQLSLTLEMLEYYFGPYPFRIDKYGVVQTAYLGMEHQTAIAWGDDFELNNYGFDYILVHESAHEWWGNLVTAADWKDLWIHESFATYAEALCAEYLNSSADYHDYVAHWSTRNQLPLAPDYSQTFGQIYGLDVYHKGALVLHTLRYLLGDNTFFTLLRRMLYPTTADEALTDGSQCRLVDSEDFIALAESLSGRDLDWFFQVYLRQPELPAIHYWQDNGWLHLAWQTPQNLPFYLPIPVRVGTDTLEVDLATGSGSIYVGADEFEIDPRRWLLKGPAVHTQDIAGDPDLPAELALHPNYPNPFNGATTITFRLAEPTRVVLQVFDLNGHLLSELVKGWQTAGVKTVIWEAANLASGTYFYRLRTDSGTITRKMLLIK